MQHLIAVIAAQLPHACAVVALHGQLLGHSLTFLAFSGAKKPSRNLKKSEAA